MKKFKFQSVAILSVVFLFLVVLCTAIFLTLKNTHDLKDILEESVKSQLISISVAAREIIDVDKFEKYKSVDDIDDDYKATLAELRSLQKQVGVDYIYALIRDGDVYRFVFDTDESEDLEKFDEYEISAVHEQAFLGKKSAGVMNVSDEFGNFNTGAVPIFRDKEIIGIICTDIDDVFIAKSDSTSSRNSIILISSMFLTMCATLAIIILLLHRDQKTQDKLFKMANYDVITGLPNRQFLLDYLSKISSKASKSNIPYAMLFIDLDNFKAVNDNAGHDAGDELLRHIAIYLDSIHENSKAFRPSAGMLNVSARIGGDEFIQIVPGIKTEEEAEAVGKKVLENFNTQVLDRYIEKYKVGLSIGIALFPYHTDNFNVLIKYSDIAMYHAKNSGKNTCRIYDDEMSNKKEK